MIRQQITSLPDKPLLRIDQVAAYFDVSEKTVRTWIKRNIIRSIRMGGTLRVYRESIQETVLSPDQPDSHKPSK